MDDSGMHVSSIPGFHSMFANWKRSVVSLEPEHQSVKRAEPAWCAAYRTRIIRAGLLAGSTSLPELPEVETVARDLRPLLIGRRIASVHSSHRPLRRPWSRKWNAALIGRRIESVSRRGKWIVIHLEEERYFVVHLGMTGQLTVVSSERPRADHTHLWLDLDERSAQLRFRDVRRFGSASLFANRATLEEFFRRSSLVGQPPSAKG